MDLSNLPHVGLLSEYQKEYLDYSGGVSCPCTHRCVAAGLSSKEYLEYSGGVGCPCTHRCVAAGLSSKGPAIGQSPDYEIGDGVVPSFRGESTSKSVHCPQPALSRLPNYKPEVGSERPPMVLGPDMMEVDSVSRSAHCPLPLALAKTTAPRWIADLYNVPKYGTRYDLTSSYQADYCGIQTKPRNICLDTRAGGDSALVEDQTKTHDKETQPSEQPATRIHNTLHDRLNDYVTNLLFRTTTGSTYQPPSVFGEIPCHPVRAKPDSYCPAEALTTVSCKIHRNEAYSKKL